MILDSDVQKVNAVQYAVIEAAMLGPIQPGEESLAIAGICASLGSLYHMLVSVSAFYKTPEHFADCCRTMIHDIAKEETL